MPATCVAKIRTGCTLRKKDPQRFGHRVRAAWTALLSCQGRAGGRHKYPKQTNRQPRFGRFAKVAHLMFPAGRLSVLTSNSATGSPALRIQSMNRSNSCPVKLVGGNITGLRGRRCNPVQSVLWSPIEPTEIIFFSKISPTELNQRSERPRVLEMILPHIRQSRQLPMILFAQASSESAIEISWASWRLHNKNTAVVTRISVDRFTILPSELDELNHLTYTD